MKILVQRTGALGDVLEVTAITRRLRAENPDALIDIETDYPAVFANNADVSHSFKSQAEYDKTIDLNRAFERTLRKDHPIDSYSEVAFGDNGTQHEIVFNWTPLPSYVRDILPPRYLVFHPCRNWPIRTLAREWWNELVRVVDLPVVVTGTMQDWPLDGVVDLRGALSLGAQAALINGAACFVCSESGPMILAQATKAPVIAMLTMTPPFRILHKWHGALVRAVPANVPCQGCEINQPEETTYFDCMYGHRDCVSSFDVKAINGLIHAVFTHGN